MDLSEASSQWEKKEGWGEEREEGRKAGREGEMKDG